MSEKKTYQLSKWRPTTMLESQAKKKKGKKIHKINSWRLFIYLQTPCPCQETVTEQRLFQQCGSDKVRNNNNTDCTYQNAVVSSSCLFLPLWSESVNSIIHRRKQCTKTKNKIKNENCVEAGTMNALWDPAFNGLKQTLLFKKIKNNFKILQLISYIKSH